MSASKNNLSQLTNKGCLNPITNLSLLLDLARADFTRLTPTEATRDSGFILSRLHKALFSPDSTHAYNLGFKKHTSDEDNVEKTNSTDLCH